MFEGRRGQVQAGVLRNGNREDRPEQRVGGSGLRNCGADLPELGRTEGSIQKEQVIMGLDGPQSIV